MPSQGQLASWPWSRRSANAAPACRPAAGESGCAGKQSAQHRKSLTSAGKLSNAQWHQPGTGGSASRSHQAGHLFHVLQAQPRRQDKAELCAAGLRGHIPQSERITLLRVGRASLCLMAVRTALRLKAAPAASAEASGGCVPSLSRGMYTRLSRAFCMRAGSITQGGEAGDQRSGLCYSLSACIFTSMGTWRRDAWRTCWKLGRCTLTTPHAKCPVFCEVRSIRL